MFEGTAMLQVSFAALYAIIVNLLSANRDTVKQAVVKWNLKKIIIKKQY